MPTADQLNAALAGRYAVDRLIGEGGMATVYLARDLRHNRRVALKVLKPDLGAVVGVERFLSEIQVTANLQHPNLLPLFDSGAAEGLLFYVMPFVDGESLRARLEREKQLPIDEAVRIAAAVAGALDYAHRHGVIHRDLKPENVLLHEGQPLIADFGIALAVSNAGGNRITQTGLSLGTPAYMSPEQATGDRVIDGRTDIYSLGAVAYEMLTGEAPHIGNTSQAIIARVLTEKPRPVRASRPSVPEHIEAAVECALEKLPADRWATAREFAEALTGARSVVRATRSIASESDGATRASAPRRSRLRELAPWGLAAIALASTATLALRASRPDTPVVRAEFEIQLPDSIQVRPFGGAAAVALSRDGSTLVFQGWRPGGTPMLFLRRLDDRDVREIRGTDSARGPVLSPNGDEVLFAVTRGQLQGAYARRVSVLGGTPRTVLDSVVANGQITWTDAGQIIAVHRRDLWIAPADGGPAQQLAALDTARGFRQYGFPHALPGGKAALITVRRTRVGAGLEDSYIGTVTIPGGQVTNLGIRGTYPRYAGTGHLLYVTPDAVLMAVPFDARRLRVSGTPVPIAEGVRTGGGGAAGYAVADNGTVVYLGGGVATGGERLMMVSRSGVERELPLRPGFYHQPRVSPDGRIVALTVATASFGSALRDPDLWRYDTTSRTLTRITTDSNSARSSWSQDGERLAYVRQRPAEARDTGVVARSLFAAARDTLLVRMPHPVMDLSLGPAGTYIAMRVSRGAQSDIWIAHLDSLGAPRPLLAEPYAEISPRLSPDGSHLAYVSDRTGRLEVYVRAIRGTGADVQVSVDGGSEPVWGRDGRELFYRGSGSVVATRLTRMPRLAVELRESLFQDTYIANSGVPNFDVFPGSQYFLLVKRGRDAIEDFPLIAIMNWHARLQAPRP